MTYFSSINFLSNIEIRMNVVGEKVRYSSGGIEATASLFPDRSAPNPILIVCKGAFLFAMISHPLTGVTFFLTFFLFTLLNPHLLEGVDFFGLSLKIPALTQNHL